MKVLIADDDDIVRQGLRRLLPWREMGFDDITEAASGDAALRLALAQHPDLIVTDIRMPIMDGLTLVGRLREILVDTYVIILSAYSDLSYLQTAIRHNVSDFVVKPLSRESVAQLEARVRDICADIQRKQKTRRLLMGGSEFGSYIRQTLQNADREELAQLFEQELSALVLQIHDAKDCCLVLQNVLFDHMRLSGYNEALVSRQRDEAGNYTLAVNNRQDLFSYTYHLYLKYLDFMTEKTDVSTQRAQAIAAYIRAHCFEPDLSVASVAQTLHLSAVYAGALFKQVENMTVNACVNGLRIEKAKSLLQEGLTAISEVGEMVGYTDPKYFARVFRKQVGMTPSEYRGAGQAAPGPSDEQGAW